MQGPGFWSRELCSSNQNRFEKHQRFLPEPQHEEPLRPDGQIKDAKNRPNGSSRAPTGIWGVFSGHMTIILADTKTQSFFGPPESFIKFAATGHFIPNVISIRNLFGDLALGS